MSEHTPTPWMTQPCGELCPDDVMIVADLGKTGDGIQQISTVAKALSIRQTAETTKANAALIVRSVNALPGLVKALEDLVSECKNPYDEGGFEDGEWPALDRARAALAEVKEKSHV